VLHLYVAALAGTELAVPFLAPAGGRAG
jgi:hypothetical protein